MPPPVPNTMKRMTANPVKPSRYRPGKPAAEEIPSDDEFETESEEEEQKKPAAAAPRQPVPSASSFATVVPGATNIATSLKTVDLNQRTQAAKVQEEKRIASEAAAKAVEDEEFETESSGSEDEDGSDEDEDDSDEESSSSEDEAPRRLIRPTFIRKTDRLANETTASDSIALTSTSNAAIYSETERQRRQDIADALVQEQLDMRAAAAASKQRQWDDSDDENNVYSDVDDTDDLDPEAEHLAWKLRELKRLKRERETIETAEAERAEIERRRNLSAEDRDREDAVHIAAQKSEQENKGKMNYMGRYFHKGAYFKDDAEKAGLDKRDLMAARVQDDVQNRELLPEYLQIRDMTKLGKKGRTRYKDLKSEDTGRWASHDHMNGNGRPRERKDGFGDVGGDARFQSDAFERGPERSGANNVAVGAGRKRNFDASDGDGEKRRKVETG